MEGVAEAILVFGFVKKRVMIILLSDNCKRGVPMLYNVYCDESGHLQHDANNPIYST